MNNKTNVAYRWWVLGLSVTAMLFAGIIYAWSILKVPFAEDFGWRADQLSLNYTLTMCFFCVGGLVGSYLPRKIGIRLTGLISALLSGGGMALSGLLSGGNVILLYLTYAVMAGLGIGIAYNLIISTVSSWFADKKGFCTGALMMGFGASSLILGSLAEKGFNGGLGRRDTFLVLGAALFVVIAVAGLALKRPDANAALPAANKSSKKSSDAFEPQDYSPAQMLRRFSFWRTFLLIAFATAVGSSVISFARDLAVSVGAKVALATTLVGVLAVCNGLGRIIAGSLYDYLGRKRIMLISTLLTIVAAGTTLASVMLGSLPTCIIGLCLTGLSYGSCPTMVVASVSSFYGSKHFASNFSIMNCNLILASFMATACSSLLTSFGSYVAPFILLLGLAVAALLLNLSLKRP